MHYAVLSDVWRAQRKMRVAHIPDLLIERLSEGR
jgi:hypothetical protein